MRRLAKNNLLLTSLGGAIAKRRTELAMSQEDLAQKAEVHRTYVSDIERGVRNVSVLTLQRISDALDIPLGALLFFGDRGVRKAPPAKSLSKRKA